MKRKKQNRKWYDPHFFIVEVDIFNLDVGFCINTTEAETKKWLKKVSGDLYKEFDESQLEDWDNSSTDLGRMCQFKGGFIVLAKTKNRDFRKFVALLVHEIVHVTHYLTRKRRIVLEEGSEEIFTYLTEFLTEKALKKLY